MFNKLEDEGPAGHILYILLYRPTEKKNNSVLNYISFDGSKLGSLKNVVDCKKNIQKKVHVSLYTEKCLRRYMARIFF